MSGIVGFFNPVDLFAIGGDWEVQTGPSPKTSRQRAQGLKSTGDEAASKLYDEKKTVTCVYECFAASGNLTLPSVGTITSTGYHIDKVDLSYTTKWPKMTVSGHLHGGANNHATDDCRTYTSSLTFPAGWGIPRALAGFALAVGDTAIAWASADYSLSCVHLDEPNPETGDWLAGENRDGTETMSVTLAGVGATITAPAGWDKTEDGNEQSNQAADTESASYEHHLEFDAVA